MNWFEWFFVISISIFVIGTLTIGTVLLIKLKQRKTVKATVILKAGGLITFWFNRDKKLVRNIGDCTYTLDETAVYKTRFRDFIYFMEGNPKPIVFNHKLGVPEITGNELNTILDDGLTLELFGQSKLKTLELLMYISLFFGFISVILGMIIVFGKVQVKDTPELRQMIYNVTRSAIMGVPV